MIFSFVHRVYQNELKEIVEKVEASNAEIQTIQQKVNENTKHIEQRRKLISELDANLSMLRLAITEIESFEYPQEADVEVMVSKFKNTQCLAE